FLARGNVGCLAGRSPCPPDQLGRFARGDVDGRRPLRLGQGYRGESSGCRDDQSLGVIGWIERQTTDRSRIAVFALDREHLDHRKRLPLVALGTPRAEYEQKATVRGRSQVVRVEAGQVTRAPPRAVGVERLPPARHQVLLIAGRALEHDKSLTQ